MNHWNAAERRAASAEADALRRLKVCAGAGCQECARLIDHWQPRYPLPTPSPDLHIWRGAKDMNRQRYFQRQAYVRAR